MGIDSLVEKVEALRTRLAEVEAERHNFAAQNNMLLDRLAEVEAERDEARLLAPVLDRCRVRLAEVEAAMERAAMKDAREPLKTYIGGLLADRARLAEVEAENKRLLELLRQAVVIVEADMHYPHPQFEAEARAALLAAREGNDGSS